DGHVWERQLTVPDTAEYNATIDLGGTNLDGLVVDQDGATVAGVQLKLITQNGESAASATSTGGGGFEFSDLESGNYAILTAGSGVPRPKHSGYRHCRR